MTVISIVIGVLGRITKGMVQELEDLEIKGQVETIQTKVLFRSAGILRRVLEICEELLSVRLQWSTISLGWCKEHSNEYKTTPNNNQQQKKKIICKIVDFAVAADHRIKLKERKKRISTSTLLENWKNYGTWRWQLYQL